MWPRLTSRMPRNSTCRTGGSRNRRTQGNDKSNKRELAKGKNKSAEKQKQEEHKQKNNDLLPAMIDDNAGCPIHGHHTWNNFTQYPKNQCNHKLDKICSKKGSKKPKQLRGKPSHIVELAKDFNGDKNLPAINPKQEEQVETMVSNDTFCKHTPNGNAILAPGVVVTRNISYMTMYQI